MSKPGIQELINEKQLSAYLAEKLPGSEPIEFERHKAGHSNITFFVKRGDREWVLRRPPLGPLPPTAHDVMREYRVLTALKDADVRSPRTVLACEDQEVIGAPFYLMERKRGHVIRDSMPPEIDGEEARRRVGEELVDALVELHAVDWKRVGLEGFGKPSGYLERQVRRWLGQWDHNRTRKITAIERLSTLIEKQLPPSPPATIVHGDYKLDNVMFANSLPVRLVGIFDWEMATIGDPLADVGFMTAFWFEPGDPSDVLLGLAPITCQSGFMSRAELVDRYERLSGRSLEAVGFYQALALWKMAILLEGSYKRFLAGTTDDPFFEQLKAGIPRLAMWALEVAGGSS